MTHLTGSAVISAPEFKNNILSFPVSYGLAIQALGVGRLNTNLVPLELVRDRTINRKKPWAVAASVLLTLGCLLNFMILWWPWSQVRIDVDEPWKAAAQKVGQVDNEIKQNENLFNAAQDKYKKTLTFGKTIVSHYDHQTDWLNLASAIATCLPDDPEDAELADLTESEKIWLTDVTVRHEKNLGSWYTPDITAKFQLNSQPVELPKIVNPEDLERREAWKGILNQKQLAEEQKINENQLPTLKPRFPSHGKPDGKGYIVQLTGYHFHDSRKHASADHFVRRTLVHNLQDQLIKLANREQEVSVRDLGISHPVVFEMRGPKKVLVEDSKGSGTREAIQYIFVVQFAWSPKPIATTSATRVATTSTNP